MTAVILAGGRGSRLRPYSLVLPKPLLPIGDEPLLSVLVRHLAHEGFRRIVLAGGALNDLMWAYFRDGRAHAVTMDYVAEPEPLGTFGALTLLDLNDSTLVLNGDLLTTIPFSEVMRFHCKTGASLTMVVKQVTQAVPWGVVEIEHGRVRALSEKPEIPLWVNTGIYVVEPEAVHVLPRGEPADATVLVKLLLEQGAPVVSYATAAYWRDIGTPDAFRSALRDYARRPELGALHDDRSSPAPE